MDVNIKTCFIILIVTFAPRTLACGIQLENQIIPFVFEETTENHTSGTQLPGQLNILRTSDEEIVEIKSTKSLNSKVAKYIEAKLDSECDCIQFYLCKNRTLREYRKEFWSPSLEFEFQLSCSLSGDSQTYTYMLGILDENLDSPEFTSTHYEGELVYSNLNGYKILLENKIIVVDADINKKHANVTLFCEGTQCAYFNFGLNSDPVMDKGYNYEIEAIPKNLKELNSEMQQGKVLTVHLSAFDGLHRSMDSAQVDFLVSANDELPTAGNNSSSYLSLMVTIGIGVFILLSCSGTVAFLAMRSRKAKDLLRKLTEAEIREFLQGNASFAAAEGKRSVDVNTPIMALPYNQSFEIRRDKLRIDETTILGTGAFGIVYKGRVMFSNNEAITVAVKTVKRNVGVLYFKALLSGM